jgi:type VI secretion system protein ImpA
MNELIEKLLQPVSAERPCGPDLSNDARLDELETILKGKPEIDFGNIKKTAEPPDWRQLRDKSTEFIRQSKHLRAGTILCCCMLKTGGFPGFRDGLQLLRGMVERYWGSVYPLLEAEDNNDPTHRLNILGALTAPRGSTSWLAIIDNLYAAPLCHPKGLPPLTFEQLQNSKLRQAGPEGASPDGPTLANLVPILRASAEQIAAHHQALQEALEAVEGLDRFLGNTLSAKNSISFEELQKTLREMLNNLQPYLPGAEPQPEAKPDKAGSAAEPSSQGDGIQIHGAIRSREDVVSALESICHYYEQIEPSSPVPFLLRRAQKLATMNFIQAVQELNLIGGLDALRPSLGSGVEAADPASQPPAS